MIVINNESNIPLYIQIYEQIKNDIIKEEILGGSKLPSIRGLAQDLNVSRNTVENAYLQLASEGYIESKPGSGYYALKLDSMELLKLTNNYSENENTEVSKEIVGLHNYDFNFTDRCYSASEFPLQIWKKISNQCFQSMNSITLTRYNALWGERDLQIELMKYLKKSGGISCNPEQIILTSGIEYSLSLFCQMFRQELPKIAMEDPGYASAKNIFNNNGYEVLPIGLKRDGINIEELNNSTAKVVYVTPSHQFPTGILMPIKKRLQLLEWAKRTNGIIIEDDYDSEFRYNSGPIPSLQSIDSIGSVVYLGTFSKSLSPSLRIGYMILPESLLNKYHEYFGSYHSTASFMQQKVLQQFMEQGHWERHLRKIRTSATRKHDLLISAIKKYMGNEVIIYGENSGLHILLEFKNNLSEEIVIKKAKEHGVLVSPVSTFWVRKENYKNNMIMISYGGIEESKILEGIRILSSAIFSTDPM